MTGYSSEELNGMHVWEIDAQWTKEEMLDTFDNYDTADRYIETTLRRKDGKLLDVEISANDATFSGEKLIFSVCRDITKRKEIERQIQEEAIRKRIFFEQSSDGIVVIDQNGKVFEANQKYAKMLGYSMDELLQLHVWDLDPKCKKEELLEIIRTNDEVSSHFETKHRRKDGSLLDVEVSSNRAIIREQKLAFASAEILQNENMPRKNYYRLR